MSRRLLIRRTAAVLLLVVVIAAGMFGVPLMVKFLRPTREQKPTGSQSQEYART